MARHFFKSSKVRSEAHARGVYSAGEYIFRENEPGDDMFIIKEGLVDILKGSDGEERQLARLEPGDFFGEMAVLEDLPRAGSARAVTECRLLRIEHSSFDAMLARNPEIAVRMLRKLSRRLRQAVGDAESQAPVAPAPQAPAAASVGREKFVHQPTGTELFLSSGPEIAVGRPDLVTGTTPDIDLSAVDPRHTVSRRHARVLRHDDRLFLFEEIGTANGSFINGDRVRTGEPAEIKDGDRVVFGSVETIFHAR